MAEYNLLQLTQEFCKRTSLPRPSTVSNAQDATTLQIWGLLNEGIQEIGDRYQHQQLQTPGSFFHGNGANYLAIDFTTTTEFPGWKFFIDETLWDSTSRTRVAGPYSPQRWQEIVTFGASQALYNYSLFGNGLYIYPVPTVPADVTFSFFYQSKFGVYSPTLGEFQDSYLLDTDQCRLPSYLMLADIKWRYKKDKGLPYAEDQRMCEEMLANAVGRVPQGEAILDRPEYGSDAFPTLYVAAGSTIPP